MHRVVQVFTRKSGARRLLSARRRWAARNALVREYDRTAFGVAIRYGVVLLLYLAIAVLTVVLAHRP